MSVRPRSRSSKHLTGEADGNNDGGTETPKYPSPSPKPRSLPQVAFSQTLSSTANLANLLPTGSLLAFQLLTPLFTHNGVCDSVTRFLTLVLLTLLACSCFLVCFTDSVKSENGNVYYGLATWKGIWLFDYYDSDDPSGKGLPDLGRYRIRIIDWIHATLTVMVFGAVALRDKNVSECLYPSPAIQVQEVLDIVPVGVGIICSLLFVVFPTRRHGIGYPITSDDKIN